MLSNSSTRAQQLNKNNTQALVTLTAPAPGVPITKLTHATGKYLMLFCTIQALTMLSRGGALQFLGFKYTLTVACFYEPLLGKVNAISLRLVMINATAHLPPSKPKCQEKKLHSCIFNQLFHLHDTLEQIAVC